MNCLRCGQKLESDGSFCASCQEEMEKFPVEPGTPLVLPKEKSAVNQPRQVITMTPEKKIARQNRTIRLLTAALLALVMLIILETALLFHLGNRQRKTPIGQNYSTESTRSK